MSSVPFQTRSSRSVQSWSMGLLAVTSLLVACGTPVQPPSTSASSNLSKTSAPVTHAVTFTFPTVSKQVRHLEVELSNQDDSTVRRAGGAPVKKVQLTLPDPNGSDSTPGSNSGTGSGSNTGTTTGGSASSASVVPQLTVEGVEAGAYKIRARALDAPNGVTLFSVTQPVMLAASLWESRSGSSTATITPSVALILTRTTGAVRVQAAAPIGERDLTFTAEVAGQTLNLNRSEDGKLSGELLSVPTGRNLIASIDGRDPVGTLLYQASQRFDLSDETLPVNFKLEQVTAEKQPPTITKLSLLAQAKVLEPVKLNAEVQPGQRTDGSGTDAGALRSAVVSWGDGSFSSLELKGEDHAPEFSHTYSMPGLFTVNLTVKNEYGLVARSSQVITVSDPNLKAASLNTTPTTDALIKLEIGSVPVNAEAVEVKFTPNLSLGELLGRVTRGLLNADAETRNVRLT
jgi:hypothetical protein